MRGVVKLQAAVRRKRAHSSFLRMDETDALPLRDAWAIWLFLAHVIAVVWVGSPFLGAESYLGEEAFDHHQARDFALALALSLCTSFAFVHCFVLVLETQALRLLYVTLFAAPSTLVAFGVAAAADAAGPNKLGYAEEYGSNLGFGIALVGGAIFLSVYLLRWRIDTSAALLSKSAALLLEMPGLITVAYGSALAATCWFLLWLPFAVYVIQHVVEHLWDDFYQQWGEGAEARYTSGEVTAICAAVYFLLLLSLYWGQNVCKGVSDVTAAGAIGAWVFVPETVAAPAPCVGLLKPVVSNALLRAMTTCFGSICFGTLVVAVVQALVATLKQLKYRRMSNCVPLGLPLKLVNCCVDCVLDAIKRAAEAFNEWALVYTGLYGRSFLASGRAVIGLVKKAGMDVAANILLVSPVVWLATAGCLLVTLAMCAALAAALGHHGQTQAIWVMLPLPRRYALAAALAVPVVSVGLSPLLTSTRTLLVCYAEADHVLRRRDPELVEQIEGARDLGRRKGREARPAREPSAQVAQAVVCV